MTVLGTRPEIIRLSRVIPLLDAASDHVLVHTGQNFHPGLSDVFFEELGVRSPDHYLGVKGETFAQQVGFLLARIEPLLHESRPDRLLILGDTNSGLVSIVARRLGIPVYHMEAGNRCYDARVPEEVNRRVIDHCSSVLLPYTHRSKEHLVREGIERERIFVTGNPIKEVIDHYRSQIDASDVVARLDIEPNRFFLVTMHRAENVDVPERLAAFVRSFDLLAEKYGFPILVSTHPRTADRMQRFGVAAGKAQVLFLEPFGFFDFINLEQRAFLVLSDSGTVQEECAIFTVPNVTIRDVTERPETLECGSNILSGADPESVLACAHAVLSLRKEWTAPSEYLVENVSDRVVKLLLGYLHE